MDESRIQDEDDAEVQKEDDDESSDADEDEDEEEKEESAAVSARKEDIFNRVQLLNGGEKLIVERINSADVIALNEVSVEGTPHHAPDCEEDEMESVQKSERFNKVTVLDKGLLRSIDRGVYGEEEEEQKIMPPKNKGSSVSMNVVLNREDEEEDRLRAAKRKQPPSPSDYQTIQQTNNFVNEEVKEDDLNYFKGLKRRSE